MDKKDKLTQPGGGGGCCSEGAYWCMALVAVAALLASRVRVVPAAGRDMLGECATPHGFVCENLNRTAKTMDCRHWTADELALLGVDDEALQRDCDGKPPLLGATMWESLYGYLLAHGHAKYVEMTAVPDQPANWEATVNTVNIRATMFKRCLSGCDQQSQQEDGTRGVRSIYYECTSEAIETMTGWEEQVRPSPDLAAGEVLLSESVADVSAAECFRGPRGDRQHQVCQRPVYTIKTPVWTRSVSQAPAILTAEPTLDMLQAWRNTTESGQLQRLAGIVTCQKTMRNPVGQLWAIGTQQRFDPDPFGFCGGARSPQLFQAPTERDTLAML